MFVLDGSLMMLLSTLSESVVEGVGGRIGRTIEKILQRECGVELG